MTRVLQRLRTSAPVVVVVVASTVVLIALAALPLRTWMDQKQATQEAADELTRMQGEVAELEVKLELLETDAEIERMARENFDLVFPGEESYRILPPPEN
ncbi:MAG: cell division protein FtsB [Acidimicrobiales bacterium]|jgi:cell division protein FtsB